MKTLLGHFQDNLSTKWTTAGKLKYNSRTIKTTSRQLKDDSRATKGQLKDKLRTNSRQLKDH